MNKNELNLKDKLRDFYEHKKKETFLIGGSILLILSIPRVFYTIYDRQ